MFGFIACLRSAVADSPLLYPPTRFVKFCIDTPVFMGVVLVVTPAVPAFAFDVGV